MNIEKKQLKQIQALISKTSCIGSVVQLYLNINKDLRLRLKPKCLSNCCQCCNDLFFISPPEFYTILFYLKEYMGEDYILAKIQYSQAMLNKLKNACPSYDDYSSSYLSFDKDLYISLHDTLENHKIRCPFLNSKGHCDIYPVRPLICRLYGWKIQCKNIGKTMKYNKYEKYNEFQKLNGYNGKFEKEYIIIDYLAELAPLLLFNEEEFKKKYQESI
ncbi:YkgJ family cysteine cluster protein [Ruminococcus albus]|nr:YkgJ family cysteine cluster protein [Ruminococcus albus]